MNEILTCAQALLTPGTCCEDSCGHTAILAVLDAEYVEHARCELHIGDAVAAKPLVWADLWRPV